MKYILVLTIRIYMGHAESNTVVIPDFVRQQSCESAGIMLVDHYKEKGIKAMYVCVPQASS